MSGTLTSMIPTLTLAVALCLAMILPHLPGRYDASVEALSFVVRVASHAALLLIPIGLAWAANPRRYGLWLGILLVLGGFVVLVTVLAGVLSNNLVVGLVLGLPGALALRALHRHRRVEPPPANRRGVTYLVAIPILLIAFQALVLPRAAAWSRDRAIRHGATLIEAIESYRERRGHYPVSLQSLNRDFPTGVMGIDRFHYEPNGEAYNLYFVRQHSALDAKEVVMYNPRDEHRFASHVLDILQFDGEELALRRGDRRRTQLTHPHWISILFD